MERNRIGPICQNLKNKTLLKIERTYEVVQYLSSTIDKIIQRQEEHREILKQNDCRLVNLLKAILANVTVLPDRNQCMM